MRSLQLPLAGSRYLPSIRAMGSSQHPSLIEDGATTEVGSEKASQRCLVGDAPIRCVLAPYDPRIEAKAQVLAYHRTLRGCKARFTLLLTVQYYYSSLGQYCVS